MRRLLIWFRVFMTLLGLMAATCIAFALDRPETIVTVFPVGEVILKPNCDEALPPGLDITDYIDWIPIFSFCHKEDDVFSTNGEKLGTLFMVHYLESFDPTPNKIRVACIFVFRFPDGEVYTYVDGTRQNLSPTELTLSYQGGIIDGTGVYAGASGKVTGEGAVSVLSITRQVGLTTILNIE